MEKKEIKAKRRENLVGLAVIVLFLFLIFWKEITLQKVIGWGGGDNSLHILAYRQEFINFLKTHKSLPFWTPTISSGFPLASDPAVAAFYPVDWFFFSIFPSFAALNYSILFHLLLASLGLYYFLKHLKLPSLASLFGVISFSGSLYLLSLTDNLSIMAATAWLPLFFLSFEKAYEKRNFYNLSLAGLILGLQLLAGYPQASFLSLLGVFLLILYRFFQNKDYPIFLYFLFIVLFGLLFASPQILLTFKLLPFTPRSTGFLAQALENSLSPLSLASFLLPALFKGIPVIIGKDIFYFGIPSFALLLFAVFGLFKSKWQVRFFSFLWLFSILCSLGKYGLIYYFLGSLPGFNLFRVPEQFLTLAIFAASVLTAYGFSELFLASKTNEDQVQKLKLYLAFVLILFFLAFIASLTLNFLEPKLTPLMHKMVKEKIYGKPPHLYPLSYYYAKFDFIYQSFKVRLSPLSSVTLIPLLSSMFLLLLLYTIKKGALKSDLFPKIVILLLLIEMFFVISWHQFLPGVKTENFQQKPEVVNFLKKDRYLYRIYSWPARLKFGLLHEEEQRTRNPEKTYKFVSENLLANFPLRYGIPTIQGVEAMWIKRQENLLNLIELKNELLPEENKLKRLGNFAKTLGMLNVKYLVSPFPLKSPYYDEVYKTNKKDHTYIYKNKFFLPRAFLVSNYKILPAKKILQQITDKDFEPLKEVLLEEKPSGFKKSQKKLSGWAKIEKYQPFCIKIKTKASANCFLVLSDTYYPNWKARVNGKKAPIYKANYFLKAVPIPEGESQVEFVYSLGEVKITILLSSLVLLAFVAMGLIEMAKKFKKH